MRTSRTGLLNDTFLQMAYVTNDFKRGMLALTELYGVPSFLELHDVEIGTIADRSCKLTVALAYVGSIQIELIHPRGGDDGIYRTSLVAEGGFQMHFHHEARVTATRDRFAEARNSMLSKGYPLVIDTTHPLCHGFYADTRRTLGHFVEYLWYTPAGETFIRDSVPHF